MRSDSGPNLHIYLSNLALANFITSYRYIHHHRYNPADGANCEDDSSCGVNTTIFLAHIIKQNHLSYLIPHICLYNCGQCSTRNLPCSSRPVNSLLDVYGFTSFIIFLKVIKSFTPYVIKLIKYPNSKI